MPTQPLSGQLHNRLLAGLSQSEQSRLREDMALVSLRPGQVLQDLGEKLTDVYFPTDSIVSLIASTRSGASTELAMTGHEGLAGISLVLGDELADHKIVVQHAGEAWRLKAETMAWELAQGGRLQQLALRYAQSVLVQMGRGLVCARLHTVEHQLSRWLLLCLDRLPDHRISMTQERIAGLLGVRREAITDAAGKLQAAGLIRYSRGRIDVLDRPGLEAWCCECYGALKMENERFLQATVAFGTPARFRANPASLRHRAEARWRELPTVPPEDSTEAAYLQHELEIRKIELEISNEALNEAHDEADALSERYADIYDFAPIGYFTLDAQGNILELNLAGAILLGLKRSQKSRHRFATYLAAECQAAFMQFVEQVLNENTTRFCEVALPPTALRPASTVRIEAVPDEDGKECRMVVMDITEQRNALLALEQSEMRYRQFIASLPLAQGIARKPADQAD